MSDPQHTTQADAAVTYKIKRVRDREGQLFQIVNQSLNGPCPLLAIVNVLLLRGNILLPQSSPDVSEERLVSLVAGWLLDRTEASEAGKATLAPEYAANLEQNVADAVSRIPKLTTGIDINPRFTGCQAYEFTDEVGIFDLLDIPLLHGWLVDPQDKVLFEAVGGASYNELLSRLIASLGEDASPVQPPSRAASSPYSAADTASTPSTATPLPSKGGPSPSLSLPPTAEGAKFTLDDEEEEGDEEEAIMPLKRSSGSFSKRLQAALALSVSTDLSDAQSGAGNGSNPTERGKQGISPAITPNSAAAKAFDSALVTPGHSRGVSQAGPLLSGTDSDQQWHSPPAAQSFRVTDGGPTSRSEKEALPAQHVSLPSDPHSPEMDADAEARTAVQRLMKAVFGRHLLSDADPATLEEAKLLQGFLSGNSQLTYHGLSELHAALTPGQLAVFFRNNHFSTLTKHNDGSLYMLVTDQGYLHEAAVVWERLATIDGDAQFVRADFSPFAVATSGGTQHEAGDQGRHGVSPASLAPPAHVDADADLALALQMQEEEAAAEESRKIRAQKLRQQQQQQQQMDDSHQQHEAPRPLQTQRRTSNPRRPTAIRGQAPPKEKCSIM